MAKLLWGITEFPMTNEMAIRLRAVLRDAAANGSASVEFSAATDDGIAVFLWTPGVPVAFIGIDEVSPAVDRILDEADQP